MRRTSMLILSKCPQVASINGVVRQRAHATTGLASLDRGGGDRQGTVADPDAGTAVDD
jgi:hypothetical protein